MRYRQRLPSYASNDGLMGVSNLGVSMRAQAVIDLDSLRRNVERLRIAAHASGATPALMGVVKADAYGHGVTHVAPALRRNGMEWLGVALPSEALALRADGDTGRILAWLIVPDDPTTAECIAAKVDMSVAAAWLLDEVAEAAREVGFPARIHVKVDTGLGRGGCSMQEWPLFVEQLRAAVDRDEVEIVGVWSHLVAGEDPHHASAALQRENFASAVRQIRAAGISAPLCHLANSGAVLADPMIATGATGGLVRMGIAMFGVSPGIPLGDPSSLGLEPVMSLRARLALVKSVPAGQGVSYGHRWVAAEATNLGLVPLGYADGIPRSANGAAVWVRGKLRPVVGSIAMDQFVIDLGHDHAEAGDEVIIFGAGSQGEPMAEDWARWSGTIGYEIVTRIGPRVPRVHLESGGSR